MQNLFTESNLNTMRSTVDEQYKIPVIAKLLHTLPHYNITFHRTNSTFRPTDEVYLEVNWIESKKNKVSRPKTKCKLSEFRNIRLGTRSFAHCIFVRITFIFTNTML